MKQKVTARAIILVIGLAILIFVNTGISNTCAYPFVVPMATDLGFETASLSFMFTFQSLLTFAGAFVSNFLIKKAPFKVMVIGGGILIALGWVIQATTSSLPVIYLASSLRGFGCVFCSNLIASTMIANWFRVATGTVTSIVVLMQSVAPAIFSTPVALALESMGWRRLSWIFAILVLVVNMVVGLVAVYAKPQDVGLLPVGAPLDGSDDAVPAQKVELPGIMMKDAMKTRQFWLMTIATVLQMFILVGFSTQRTPAIMAMGVDLVQSQIVVSVLSALAIAYQFIFGVVVDRLGVRVAFCGISVLYVIAMVIGALSPQGFGWAMLFGCLTAFYSCGSMYMSQAPRELFGVKDFGRIMAFINTPAMAATVVGSTIMNTLVTLCGGSFRIPLWIWAGLIIVCMILVCLAHTKKNRFAAGNQTPAV